MKSTADQYRIIATGAGWVDQRSRGRLRFDGRDAQRFLQALVTNDVQALVPGGGVYAAYLTPQGRMLGDLTIYHRGDHLLAEVPAGQAGPLAARFDQLIFTEDVRVSDVSASVSQISVVGEHAAAVLSHALSLVAIDPDQISSLPVLGFLQSGEAIIVRTGAADLPIFDLFVTAEAFDGTVVRLEELGAVRAPAELLEALRIESGRPAYGADMTEDTIPLEAGLLERAISTTKGCYVGQEVIVRILHRGGGRVAKRLVKLRFDSSVAVPPPAGAPLFHAGRDVGRVTSAVISPSRGVVIALGYVHRDTAELGVKVSVRTSAGEQVADITGFAG